MNSGDCIEGLHASGFHPWEEESLLGAAHWLRRLGNNRDFLGDMLLDELKRGVKAAEDASDYGPQVIMLSTLGSEFYMRANFWPSRDEHMFRASGRSAFSYELPHDHDFDFLTVGYFGPGYASDYWEYDYERVAGVDRRGGGAAVCRTLDADAGQADALPRASRRAFAIAARKPLGLAQHHARGRGAGVARSVPVRCREGSRLRV